MDKLPGPFSVHCPPFPVTDLFHRPIPENDSCPLRICAIADWNYLPFFVGLWRNLRAVHGEKLSVDFLALDERTFEFATGFLGERGRCLRLSDVWSGEELGVISRRKVADRAYASKSRLLARAIERRGAPVFYLDLDLFFFRSPVHLLEELGDAPIMLFPQWGDSVRLVRDYGIFNAGMLLVSPAAGPFLEWWSSLCLREYETDVKKGYFVDQGFLDLVPLYFPAAKIYRGRDENVAGWNLSSLGVHRDESGFGLSDGRPVGSFHAVNPDWLGLYEVKAVWDQLAWLESPLKELGTTPALIAQTLSQQKCHSRALSRLDFFMARLQHLGIRPDWRNERTLRFFCAGPGRVILAMLAAIHYPTRSIQHEINALWEKWRLRGRAHYSFWINLQKKVFQD